jgi:hypothetical protein
MRHRERICWLLLIFNLHNLIAKLERSEGADSMHDQRGHGACFHRRKRESSGEGWEKERRVLA